MNLRRPRGYTAYNGSRAGGRGRRNERKTPPPRSSATKQRPRNTPLGLTLSLITFSFMQCPPPVFAVAATRSKRGSTRIRSLSHFPFFTRMVWHHQEVIRRRSAECDCNLSDKLSSSVFASAAAPPLIVVVVVAAAAAAATSRCRWGLLKVPPLPPSSKLPL